MNVKQIVATARETPGWMSAEELAYLCHVAQSFDHAITWVEVGCWRGRSLTAVGLALPENSTLVAVDHCKGQLDEDDAELNRQFVGERDMADRLADRCDWIASARNIDVKLYIMDSRDCAQRVRDVDVAFIDAGHTAANVEADCRAWSHAKLLMGHDCDRESVRIGLHHANVLWEHSIGSIWVRA